MYSPDFDLALRSLEGGASCARLWDGVLQLFATVLAGLGAGGV
jgi:hypothetical protein